MKEWHYLKGVDSIGPLEQSEIVELIQKGEISRDTMIWKQGFKEWQKVCNTNFSSNISIPPPPPPSAKLSHVANSVANSAKASATFTKSYWCMIYFPICFFGIIWMFVDGNIGAALLSSAIFVPIAALYLYIFFGKPPKRPLI